MQKHGRDKIGYKSINAESAVMSFVILLASPFTEKKRRCPSLAVGRAYELSSRKSIISIELGYKIDISQKKT